MLDLRSVKVAATKIAEGDHSFTFAFGEIEQAMAIRRFCNEDRSTRMTCFFNKFGHLMGVQLRGNFPEMLSVGQSNRQVDLDILLTFFKVLGLEEVDKYD